MTAPVQTDGPTSTAPPGSLRTLLAYARPHRAALGLSLLLTLLSSACVLVAPLVARTVLDELTVRGPVIGSVLLLVVLFIVGAVLTGLKTWLQLHISERVVRGVRRHVIHQLIRLRIPVLDRHPPADLAARVTSDSTLLQNAATEGMVMIVNGVLTLLASILLMATLNLVLLAVTVAVLAMVCMVMTLILPRIRATVVRAQTSVGRIAAALDRALGAARTVKANGAEARETERAYRATEDAYRAGLTGAKYGAIADTVSGSALQLAFLAVLGVGGALVAADELSLSALIAFLLYVFYLYNPIMSLTTGATLLAHGLGAVGRIEQTMAMDIETDVDTELRATGTSPPAPTIEVHDVTFGYPERAPVLRNVTLRMPTGTQTAVVGLSGAGKTTLFALLQRFYEPQCGAILVDGVDIRSLSRAEVRRRVAYVEQDAPMLEGTIRENLTYAAPEANDDEIERVLRLTRMDGLTSSLPLGLDTVVGPRGVTLSGGERQRLAIARALLRRPQVLLLDEATAQLDARNERALRDAVSDAARFCTVVLIAHRLSTVTDVDQIVVLEHGMVRVTGTHESLVANDELYRELASTQLLLS